MTVYQISGSTLDIEVDGGTGTLSVTDCVNPITGQVGINTVRVVNTSTSNLATMTFTPDDAVYTFTNVTGTPSGAGANAKFDVTVAYSGYEVAIANAGTGYSNTETITILGNNLGGTTTANDLTLTLTVGTAGKITSVAVAGTQQWPQSETGNITLLPRTEDFIQVTNNASVGCYFTSSGNDGNLLITPVTVIG